MNRTEKIRWGLMLKPGRGEVEASQLLQSAGYEVVRQTPIAGYFVDIAIPAIGVAVEIDAPTKHIRRRQKRRQKRIEAEGWVVVRCTSDSLCELLNKVNEAKCKH